MKKEKHEKQKNAGYGLRLSFAIILLIFGAACLLPMILIPASMGGGDNNDYFIMFLVFGLMSALMLVGGVLQCVAAVKGKTKNWANTISIVIGCIFVWVYFLGVLAIVGGSRGKKALRAAQANTETIANDSVSAGFISESDTPVKSTAYDGAKDMQLKIISIPDKEWKEYRNQASQDELLVLGIGMKIWLSKTRISSLFFALGLLLSVVIGFVVLFCANEIAGAIILVLGYIVFCTLCMRRRFVQDSLDQARRKLTADNKRALDAEFKSSVGMAVADGFISVMLLIISEPYFLALGIVSAVLPSVMNTKLVIPEGFGFEALEEIKSYYAERSFLSESMESIITYNREYGGSSSKQITVDGKNLTKMDYVADDGSEVYHDEYGNTYYSADGGKSVISSTNKNIVEHEAELEQIRIKEAEKQSREEDEAEQLSRLNELNNKR